VNRSCGINNAFLNYGYAALDPCEESIELQAEEECEQHYSLRLYHRVASAIDLRGKDVLDVGCGRGGGASFVMRHLGPRSVTGVDYVQEAVASCNSRYRLEGLSFTRGDAEDLPFSEDSFDVVLNVESSHCYPSVDRFFEEVVRVLRTQGYLLFADLRAREQMDRLRDQLTRSGLSIVAEESITRNVLRALELDSDRRLTQIRSRAPRWIHPSVANFAGVEGSPVFEALRTGRVDYVRFVAQKRGTGAAHSDR
jgi:ubiquinone/menaquinone biosynthesis C-methylase UbiE